MSDESKPVAERSYRMGDVGAGARVAQSENISWLEGVAGLPDGPALAQQFTALVERIAKDTSLNEDTRELAKAKTEAVAEGLAKTKESPGALRPVERRAVTVRSSSAASQASTARRSTSSSPRRSPTARSALPRLFCAAEPFLLLFARAQSYLQALLSRKL